MGDGIGGSRCGAPIIGRPFHPHRAPRPLSPGRSTGLTSKFGQSPTCS